MRNYHDPLYKKWRKRVYTRDGWQCQWPGCTRKKKLRAHHIKPWSVFPMLRFIVSNGITLCREHHDSIHGREGDYATLFLSIVAQKKK